MKHRVWKRITALVFAAMLAMAMGLTAFADESLAEPAALAQKALSVKGDNGNTYSAYQVLAVDKLVKSDKEDGSTVATFKVSDAFAGFFGEGKTYTYDPVAGQIKKGSTVIVETAEDPKDKSSGYNSTDIAEFSAALSKYARDKKIAAVQLPTAVDPGYYLVLETASGTSDQKEVASKPMLVNVLDADRVLEPKNNSVDLDKEITDEEGENETKANEVNIGDTVYYKVSTSFPDYLLAEGETLDAEKLQFVLTDTFSQGLTYTAGTLEIEGYKEGEDYTVSGTATEEGYTGGGTLIIAFKPATILQNLGKDLTLTYEAVLNENAKVDSTEGNPNDIELQYTNNPSDLEQHKTLTDETKTYTYGFNLNKVDKATPSVSLNDAKFTVTDEEGNTVYFVENPDGTYTVVKEGTEGAVTEVVSQGYDKDDETKEAGLAILRGLEAGTYTLTETQAPDAYTKLEKPVIVVITDRGEQEEGGKPSGEGQVAIGGTEENPSAEAAVTNENGEKTGEAKVEGNTISLNVYVPNQKGVSLPETGSRTALYCMIGGAAVVVLGGLYYGIFARGSRK